MRTPRRKDFAVPPLDKEPPAARREGGPRDRLDRQDRRHFRPSRQRATNARAKITTATSISSFEALATTADGGLIFVNLVDFDTEWGHRRDVPASPRASRRSTGAWAKSRAAMRRRLLPDHRRPRQRSDLPRASITPASTCRSSPSACGAAPGPIGARKTLADIAETIAAKLGLPKGPHGTAWQA